MNRLEALLAGQWSPHPLLSLRKPLTPPADPDQPVEVDVWACEGAQRHVDALLSNWGFHRLAAPGHQGHRFYLAARDGRWCKIDIKVARPQSRPDPTAPRRTSLPRLRVITQKLARRRPPALRRAGPVIAVLGPDGAGKGTVIQTVRARIPAAVSIVYLGRRRRVTKQRPKDGVPRSPRGALLESVSVIRWAIRYGRRLLNVYALAWRGSIVLCDRHPIEALAVRPRHTQVGRALERLIASSLLPWPDEVVVLDAPGSVMHARKGEHTPEKLEGWRQRYRDALVPYGAHVVSTEGPPKEAADALSALVWSALARQRRW